MVFSACSLSLPLENICVIMMFKCSPALPLESTCVIIMFFKCSLALPLESTCVIIMFFKCSLALPLESTCVIVMFFKCSLALPLESTCVIVMFFKCSLALPVESSLLVALMPICLNPPFAVIWYFSTDMILIMVFTLFCSDFLSIINDLFTEILLHEFLPWLYRARSSSIILSYCGRYCSVMVTNWPSHHMCCYTVKVKHRYVMAS